ncbi:MAG: sigma factor-like helix-turn-helix DNA-binding protein [Bacilli bacterium]
MVEECIKNARKAVTDANTEEYRHIIDLCKFTNREKDIIEMKYIKGFTHIEIGLEIGLSEATIKKCHNRILKKITRVL